MRISTSHQLRIRVSGRRVASAPKLLVAALGLSVGGILPWGSLLAVNDAYSPDATSGLFSNSFTLGTTTPTTGGTSSPASGDSLYFGAVTTGTTALTNDLTGYTFAGFNYVSGAAAFTIGGNDFTLSGGITNSSTSLQTINNNITLAATQTVNTNTGNVTLGGIIGDGGSAFGLTKAGSGTLTLLGANTYTGATTISTGTIQLGNANAVQNSTVANAVTNGLQFSSGIGTFNVGGLSGTSAIALSDTASSAVTLSVGANNANTTYAAALTGSGSFVKVGSGTLILTVGSTFTGTTTVSGGTLQLGNNTASGSVASTGGAVTVGLGATLAFNRSSVPTPGYVIQGAGSVTVDGAGVILGSQTSTFTGGLFINSGTVSTSTNGGLGAANNAITLGSGASNVTLTLTSTNASALRGNITVAAGAGTRFFTSSSTGAVATAAANTLTLNKNLNVAVTGGSAGVLTIQGAVSGTGGLIVDSTNVGTIALSKANNYSGGTTVNAGALTLNANATLGLGNVAVAGSSTLTLLNSAAIADSAILNFASTSFIKLNGPASTSDTLAAITNGTTTLNTAGTYTASALNAFFGGSSFSSSLGETFTVTPVPEPATIVGGLLMVSALGWKTRRRLGAWVRA